MKENKNSNERLYVKTASGKVLLSSYMGYENLKQYCKLLLLTHNEVQICRKTEDGKFEKLCQCYTAKDMKPKFVEKRNINNNKKPIKEFNSYQKMDYKIEKVNDELQIIVPCDILKNKIEHLINEIPESRIQRNWQSMYNQYVIYDYEPFNCSGFNLVYTIKFNDTILRDYYAFRIESKLNEIAKLEKQLLLEEVK